MVELFLFRFFIIIFFARMSDVANAVLVVLVVVAPKVEEDKHSANDKKIQTEEHAKVRIIFLGFVADSRLCLM